MTMSVDVSPIGARDGADEGIQPAVLRLQTGHALRGDDTQGRRAAVAVDGGPHGVAGQLCRVGEVQEGAARQRRVEEVLAGAAEHFLADDDAEADTQGRLPQRQVRRADQGEQDRGDEEALVDLVAALDREQYFPEPADDKGHGVDRQEIQRRRTGCARMLPAS
jgi:hypothetical protein